MELLIWTALCLLASVGIVYCIGWVVSARKRPRGIRGGYRVIPLYNHSGLEEQLRYSLSRSRWQSREGELVLLVDMGLSGDSLAVCEGVLRENPGLFFCTAEQMVETVTSLDRWQSRR